MALSSTIALNDDASTPVSHSFVTVGVPSSTGIRRLDSATSLAAPNTFLISHQLAVPKVGSAVDRHLIQFKHDKANATSGLVESLIVNVTISVPRSTTFVQQDVYDQIKFATNFMTHGNLDSIVRGEA